MARAARREVAAVSLTLTATYETETDGARGYWEVKLEPDGPLAIGNTLPVAIDELGRAIARLDLREADERRRPE